MCIEVINGMAEEIENLEKKLAEREWIPVSERLPECDDDVLVTLWWGYGKPEVWIIDYAEVKRGAKHGQSKDEKILAHITAWMPLPEPYKGGAE